MHCTYCVRAFIHSFTKNVLRPCRVPNKKDMDMPHQDQHEKLLRRLSGASSSQPPPSPPSSHPSQERISQRPSAVHSGTVGGVGAGIATAAASDGSDAESEDLYFDNTHQVQPSAAYGSALLQLPSPSMGGGRRGWRGARFTRGKGKRRSSSRKRRGSRSSPADARFPGTILTVFL